jgi:hypothetical protein
MSFEATLTAQHQLACAALNDVSQDVSSYRSLSDDVLLDFARTTAQEQKLVGASMALIAGEVARRSALTLGSEGLAQRTGYRTAIELVKVTTGLTGRDAAAAVRVGELTQNAVDAGTVDASTGEIVEDRPWLRGVAAGLAAGTLSIAAADAITSGLGVPIVPTIVLDANGEPSSDPIADPSDGVTAEALASAVDVLLADARVLDADRLFKQARRMRDELDAAGIAGREAARYEARSLKFIRLPDGMAKHIWTMDPETAAIIGDVYDRALFPKSGGPRFTDPLSPAAVLAQQISDDARSPEQYASDVFTELVTAGSTADTSRLPVTGGPVVRILALKTVLEAHDTDATAANETDGSPGYLEGADDPISVDTVDRARCTGSEFVTWFDDHGAAVDVSPERRLFTARQKILLAVLFGGCVFPGCTRPPSATEAHHINFVARDGGKTLVADGVLLCRHHHLLVHNNGWEIVRTGTTYHLIPPLERDPDQTPILITARSRAHRDLLKPTLLEPPGLKSTG